MIELKICNKSEEQRNNCPHCAKDPVQCGKFDYLCMKWREYADPACGLRVIYFCEDTVKPLTANYVQIMEEYNQMITDIITLNKDIVAYQKLIDERDKMIVKLEEENRILLILIKILRS